MTKRTLTLVACLALLAALCLLLPQSALAVTEAEKKTIWIGGQQLPMPENGEICFYYYSETADTASLDKRAPNANYNIAVSKNADGNLTLLLNGLEVRYHTKLFSGYDIFGNDDVSCAMYVGVPATLVVRGDRNHIAVPAGASGQKKCALCVNGALTLTGAGQLNLSSKPTDGIGVYATALTLNGCVVYPVSPEYCDLVWVKQNCTIQSGTLLGAKNGHSVSFTDNYNGTLTITDGSLRHTGGIGLTNNTSSVASNPLITGKAGKTGWFVWRQGFNPGDSDENYLSPPCTYDPSDYSFYDVTFEIRQALETGERDGLNVRKYATIDFGDAEEGYTSVAPGKLNFCVWDNGIDKVVNVDGTQPSATDFEGFTDTFDLTALAVGGSREVTFANLKPKANLDPGIYTGTVTCISTPTGNADPVVPVVFVVTPNRFPVTVNLKLDGAAYAGQTLALQKSNETPVALNEQTGLAGTYKAAQRLENDTYKLLRNGTYTRMSITVGGMDPQATIDYYTVSFDLQGHGSAIPDQIVLKHQLAALPSPAPTQAGYVFGGWYTEAACTHPWNSSNLISARTVLYAKWTDTGVSISSRGSTTFTQGGAPGDAYFTITSNDPDFNASRNFVGALLDGSLSLDLGMPGAPGADGEVEDGSILATLYQAKLNQLAAGSHTVTFRLGGSVAFEGKTIDGTLTVLPKKNAPAPPQTGDGAAPTLWAVLGLLGALGAWWALGRRSRRKA